MVRTRRKLPNTFIQLPKYADEEVIDKGPTANCSGTRFRLSPWAPRPPCKGPPLLGAGEGVL